MNITFQHIVYCLVIFITFFTTTFLYNKYLENKFSKLKKSKNQLYKSSLFYSYLFLYLVYIFFINFYYTNYEIIYLFYSFFIIISFCFGILSSSKYGLFKGTIYFLIPVLLLLISILNFTKDSFFTIVITGFLFFSFYFGVFINGFFIILSKEKQQDKINLQHILSYLIGIIGIIIILMALKESFNIYEMKQISKNEMIYMKSLLWK